MDDNNYMNNDNRSSGTPDNTGVFGQSSGTANGSDSRRTHTVSRQTHIISLYPSRKVGMHMDSHQTRQAAQTDMSIIRAVHMVMQIRVHTIRIQMPRVHTTRTHMLRAHLISQLTDRRSMASSQTDRVATIRPHTDRQPTISHSMELIHTTSRQRTAMALV